MPVNGPTLNTMNHASTQIGTSNCHGFSGSLDYVIELVGRCNVLCSNETWIRVGDESLIESTLSQCNELRGRNITVFSKSGMEDAEPDYARCPLILELWPLSVGNPRT